MRTLLVGIVIAGIAIGTAQTATASPTLVSRRNPHHRRMSTTRIAPRPDRLVSHRFCKVSPAWIAMAMASPANSYP